MEPDGHCAQNAALFSRHARASLRRVEPARTAGQVVPGHGHYMRRESALRRDVHLLPQGRARVAQGRSDRKPMPAPAKKNADVSYPPWDSLKAEDRAGGSGGGRDGERRERAGRAALHRARDRRDQSRSRGTCDFSPPIRSTARRSSPIPTFRSPRRRSRPSRRRARTRSRISKRVDGVFTALGTPQRFQVVDVDSVPGRVMATLAEQRKIAELERSVLGASALVNETLRRVAFLKRAIDETPSADTSLGAARQSPRAAAAGRPGVAHRRSDAGATAGADDAVARRAAARRDRQRVGAARSRR